MDLCSFLHLGLGPACCQPGVTSGESLLQWTGPSVRAGHQAGIPAPILPMLTQGSGRCPGTGLAHKVREEGSGLWTQQAGSGVLMPYSSHGEGACG